MKTAHTSGSHDGHLECNQAAIGMPDEMERRDAHLSRDVEQGASLAGDENRASAVSPPQTPADR